MGVVQSKKNGIVRKFQLKINTKAEIQVNLLQLTNWSFPDIKQLYGTYARYTECPYIDFFVFHKLMSMPIQACRVIFETFSQGDKYINIFELIAMLILTSHNEYRKKLQFFFVMFDFDQSGNYHNRQLLLLFNSIVYGFCRFTNQPKPNFDYLDKYSFERFIKVSTLEALEKVVTYRRLIQQVEGSDDAFEIFKRFDKDQYKYFKQDAYLFKNNQFKKYSRIEIQKFYRIIKKAYTSNNYEQVEIEDRNRFFRLQNRKTDCLRKLIEQKEQKFKTKPFKTLKSTMSVKKLRNTLPSLTSSITLRKSLTKLKPKLNSINNAQKEEQMMKLKMNPNSRPFLFLNGRSISKADIFETIIYFKTLSNNQPEIRIKEFFKTFEKKVFMKKQLSSLFRYFDHKKKGQVTFQDFLKVFYPGIHDNELQTIRKWFSEYKDIYEADNFSYDEMSRRKQKKNGVQLPVQALKRIDDIFNSIDKSKKGYLIFEDLKQAYSGTTILEIEEMLKDFGKNNRIYKEQFIKMILPQQWTIEGTEFIGT